MNPATLQPHRRTARSTASPASLAEDLDAFPETFGSAPAYFYLEPGREGLLFAAACVLGSALLYVGVLVAQSLV